jgi:hypothetical protein
MRTSSGVSQINMYFITKMNFWLKKPRFYCSTNWNLTFKLIIIFSPRRISSFNLLMFELSLTLNNNQPLVFKLFELNVIWRRTMRIYFSVILKNFLRDNKKIYPAQKWKLRIKNIAINTVSHSDFRRLQTMLTNNAYKQRG